MIKYFKYLTQMQLRSFVINHKLNTVDIDCTLAEAKTRVIRYLEDLQMKDPDKFEVEFETMRRVRKRKNNDPECTCDAHPFGHKHRDKQKIPQRLPILTEFLLICRCCQLAFIAPIEDAKIYILTEGAAATGFLPQLPTDADVAAADASSDMDLQLMNHSTDYLPPLPAEEAAAATATSQLIYNPVDDLPPLPAEGVAAAINQPQLPHPPAEEIFSESMLALLTEHCQ